MKLKLTSTIGAAVVAAFALTSAANAAFISGEITFTGEGTLNATPTLATSIDFPAPTGRVTTAIGSYSPIPAGSITGALVTFTDFAFGALGATGPLSVNPLWTVVHLGVTYEFELQAITANIFSAGNRQLNGTGLAKISGGGYVPTPGNWTFSTDGSTTEISFSSSTKVPDGGTTVALLGFSLLGLHGVRRKLSIR